MRQPPPGFETCRVDVTGTRLSVTVGGRGEPLLLLHGWPQTSNAWRRVVAPLAAQGYQVIVPDLRGLGASERATDGYAKDDQAEDMRQLLEGLGVTVPVRLVGHDIGGMVAFSFARLHPDRVARLALIELAVPGYGLEQAMDVAHAGLFHFGLFMTAEVPELLLQGHERAFFDWWFQRMAADEAGRTPAAVDDAVTAYSGHDSLRCGFEHYRTLLADGRTNRAWGAAGGTLRMPVLAVGAEHGTGSRLAEWIRPIAPHSQTLVVAGSGHFVPEERPAELLAALTPFLR